MAYNWFNERELERIRSNSDFRFAASLYLHVGTHAADPDLQTVLAYVTTAPPEAVPPALRKDVQRLASGQRILELTDGVLNSDLADAILSYQEAGGSLEKDFSPNWAGGVIERVSAAMSGTQVLPQVA